MSCQALDLLTLNASVIEMAKEFKCSRGAVYQSLNGAGSRRLRVAIAVKVRKKPSELWADNDHDSLVTDNALYFMKVVGYE